MPEFVLTDEAQMFNVLRMFQRFIIVKDDWGSFYEIRCGKILQYLRSQQFEQVQIRGILSDYRIKSTVD